MRVAAACVPSMSVSRNVAGCVYRSRQSTSAHQAVLSAVRLGPREICVESGGGRLQRLQLGGRGTRDADPVERRVNLIKRCVTWRNDLDA